LDELQRRLESREREEAAMQESNAPIIQSFRMLGIHGYKDISIDFQSSARIVIAENGAGKTTILSALYAFLKGDFERFRRLSFDSIECCFSGQSTPLVLRRNAIAQQGESSQDSRIAEWARIAGVEPVEIRTIIFKLDFEKGFEYSSHPVLEYIYLNSPLSPEEMAQQAAAIRADIEETLTDDIKGLASQISAAVSNYEILYLPTYRRVELPLSKRESNRVVRRDGRVHHQRGRVASLTSKWTNFGIQFGLSDVEERINEIFEQIQRQSNIGYRVISANIIDDLLGGRQLGERPRSVQLPKIEDLQIFFARIQTLGSRDRLRAIQSLYETSAIEDKSNETLRYFLTKLSTVVDQTKELEKNIQGFVAKVNDYLKQSSDEKNLVYDAAKMKVQVRNLWTDQIVKLDDLSSGEKQVISILAHFYLDQKMKIVLIDEPELSLSMDWQKRLLPDVVSSPTCAQLLAITHSPFISDNNLDPYAGPLAIERRGKVKND
jgi:predicted ATPase